MARNNEAVGVIIGRFHVPVPHGGHRALVKHVQEHHSEVLLVLGISATYATEHDPLPFELRRSMMSKEFPGVAIEGLKDVRSNEIWSTQLDELIRTRYPERSAVLYGSRNSFIESYSGTFETALVPEVDRRNGTAIRERIGRFPSITSAFRRGVIWAIQNRAPITYPTVDVGIYRRNVGNERPAIEVLLGRKPHDPPGKYRFLGGFVDPTDHSYEAAMKRERAEEAGDLETGPLEYVGSRRVDDWRYRGTKDGIMTTLFRCQYIFGCPQAKDDISETAWFDLAQLAHVLVEEHMPLGELYQASFAAIPRQAHQSLETV